MGQILLLVSHPRKDIRPVAQLVEDRQNGPVVGDIGHHQRLVELVDGLPDGGEAGLEGNFLPGPGKGKGDVAGGGKTAGGNGPLHHG